MGPLAITPLRHEGPWTEADLADLPEDVQRFELVEGTLLVHPPPSGRHQALSLRLAALMQAACPPELIVVEAIGVRVPGNTVLIPDVVVARRDPVMAAAGGIVAVGDVLLVVEIVSPGSRTADRVPTASKAPTTSTVATLSPERSCKSPSRSR